MKNYLLYKVCLGVVLLFIACLIFNGCTEKQPDPILIQVGDYTVTRSDFKKALGRLEAEGMDNTAGETVEQVADDLINAGLLVNLARQHGYTNDRNYQQEMQFYTHELYGKYGKLTRCGLQGLPIDTDRKQEHSGERITSTIDYVYIPSSQKDIYKEMRERMDAGANTEDLIKTTRFEEWNRQHLRFYTDVSTRTALLPEKVLEKISTMKPGELAHFEDGTGKYIVKVKKQLFEQSSDGSAAEHVLQVKMAECVEKGDTLMDSYDLTKQISINQSLYDLGDFFILPVVDTAEEGNSDPVVAEFEGQKIHETELSSQINDLPISVQALFRNDASRVYLITNYIAHRYAYLADIRQRAEQDNRNKLRLFLYQRLREEKITDTVSWLKGILSDSAGISRLKSRLDITPNKAPHRMEKSLDYSWLFDDRQPGRENLRLNFPVIHKMNIGKGMGVEDNEVLAESGQWKLKAGEFKMQVEQMSFQSRVRLIWNDNTLKAIYYIAHELGGPNNKAAIRINYNVVERVDMVGPSFDSLNSSGPAEAVATLGRTRLSEDRIRQKVASMPPNQRFKLLPETDSRKEALISMLLDQYWQDQVDLRQLEGNAQFREELAKYKNWLLAKTYYEKVFYVEPFEADDELLDLNIRRACKTLSEERLTTGLLKTARQSCIKVNTDLLRELGVDISRSAYSGLINKNCP